MRSRIFIFIAIILLSVPVFGQKAPKKIKVKIYPYYHLKKQRMFRVDPASFLFNEVRVSVEQQWSKRLFWYLSPNGYHQTWLSRDVNKWNQPTIPQKYYGLGLRAGAKYYFRSDGEPMGLYFLGMLGERFIWVTNMSDNLEIAGRTWYNQVGIGATLGYQWLYGAKRNLCYGFMAGAEYYGLSFYQSGFGSTSFVRNWYELPFLGPFLPGLRVYLGFEVGFAMLQKRLHW